jgi:hypothetical protein
MSTLGWIVLALAFLIFMMVANNSWHAVWLRIQSQANPGGTQKKETPQPSTTPGTLPDWVPGGDPGQSTPNPLD